MKMRAGISSAPLANYSAHAVDMTNLASINARQGKLLKIVNVVEMHRHRQRDEGGVMERWNKDKLIRFALLFLSLNCADAKMRNRANRLLKKLTTTIAKVDEG